MLQRLQTPWRSILTSVPLWATMIAHAGQSWGYLTFVTEVPTYMSSVLKFNIKKVSAACPGNEGVSTSGACGKYVL